MTNVVSLVALTCAQKSRAARNTTETLVVNEKGAAAPEVKSKRGRNPKVVGEYVWA